MANIEDTLRDEVIRAEAQVKDLVEAFDLEHIGGIDFGIVADNVSSTISILTNLRDKCREVESALTA